MTKRQLQQLNRNRLSVVYESIRQDFGVEATFISREHCETADSWSNIPAEKRKHDHHATWSWVKEYSKVWDIPKLFSIALLRGGKLGGLCLGRVTKSEKGVVKLELVK